MSLLDHLVVRLGERGISTGDPEWARAAGCTTVARCVRLALADRRVGHVGRSNLYSKPAARKRAHGRIGRAHIPRLVCRQGPPDFESGLAT
jgi:hypothetical protein